MNKIKQLLASENIPDVLIGWELLKLEEIPKNSRRWFPYFNIFSLGVNKDTNSVKCELIKEIVGDDYFINKMWNKWVEHNDEWKRNKHYENT